MRELCFLKNRGVYAFLLLSTAFTFADKTVGDRYTTPLHVTTNLTEVKKIIGKWDVNARDAEGNTYYLNFTFFEKEIIFEL